MKPVKTIYFSDELNDDFAGTHIKRRPLPANFRYVLTDPFSKLASFLVYWLVAKPVLWLTGKIGWGVAVKGKRNLRGLRNQGAFYYCNHTQICDGWLIQAFVSRNKTYLVSDQDATSIRGIRYFLQLLGCIPVPENAAEHEKYIAAIKYHIKKRHSIAIFPEAHIWPYTTRIRNFGDAAFTYPAELGAPTVPLCVTYRARKFRNDKAPLMTVHIGRPIYPDMSKSLPERRKELRDRVYEYMVDKSAEDENEEYYSYVKKAKSE